MITCYVDSENNSPHFLRGYTHELHWDPAVLEYMEYYPGAAAQNLAVNDDNAAAGWIRYLDLVWNPDGGDPQLEGNLVNFKFKTIGPPGSTTKLDLVIVDLSDKDNNSITDHGLDDDGFVRISQGGSGGGPTGGEPIDPGEPRPIPKNINQGTGSMEPTL